MSGFPQTLLSSDLTQNDSTETLRKVLEKKKEEGADTKSHVCWVTIEFIIFERSRESRKKRKRDFLRC
jgi:hypothetical protein